MALRRPLASLLGSLTLAAALVASRAGAQPPERDTHKYSEWQSKEATPFVSSASDAGVVYARPHLTLGYGAPFWQFVGVDGYALATNEFAAGAVAWRACLPFFDVQLGSRWNSAYARRFLPKQARYTPDDLPMRDGSTRSVYQVMELEATLLAPVLGGVAFTELHPLWVVGHKDENVYEEAFRAVIAPPFAMRTRLGYLFKLGPHDMVKLGAMAEHILAPGRPADTLRIGPLTLVDLGHHFEGLFTVTLPVTSPDDLGLYFGSYAFLGLRYRFAHRF